MTRIQRHDSHASYEIPNFWIHQHSCLTKHVRADPPVCLFAHTRIICEVNFIPHRHPLFYSYEVTFHFARQEYRDHWSSRWFVFLCFFTAPDEMNLPVCAESRTEVDGHFECRPSLKLKFHETLENLMERQVAIKTPSAEHTKRGVVRNLARPSRDRAGMVLAKDIGTTSFVLQLGNCSHAQHVFVSFFSVRVCVRHTTTPSKFE